MTTSIAREPPRSGTPATTRSPVSLTVLVADDERNIRRTLRIYLESLGCKVTEAGNGEQVLSALDESVFDLLLLDLCLGEDNGIELIPAILGKARNMAIVVVTAYATFETAVSAVKAGAFDYLPKPFTAPQIERLAQKIAEQRRVSLKIQDLEARPSRVSQDVLGGAYPIVCALSFLTAGAGLFCGSSSALVVAGLVDLGLTVAAGVLCGFEPVPHPCPGRGRRTTPAERALHRAHWACLTAFVAAATSGTYTLALLIALHAALLIASARALIATPFTARRPACPTHPSR